MPDFYGLKQNQVAERKLLITVAEWKEGTSTIRQKLGVRTEDSSIEMNNDMETTTDVCGANWTDVNKTQPQQDFDPFYVQGGSTLAYKLDDIRRRNAVSEYAQFTVYVITAYKGTAGAYQAERHSNCTIVPNSLGGSTKVNMPISVYFSNDWEGSGAPSTGTVSALTDNFNFSPDSQG